MKPTDRSRNIQMVLISLQVERGAGPAAEPSLCPPPPHMSDGLYSPCLQKTQVRQHRSMKGRHVSGSLEGGWLWSIQTITFPACSRQLQLQLHAVLFNTDLPTAEELMKPICPEEDSTRETLVFLSVQKRTDMVQNLTLVPL